MLITIPQAARELAVSVRTVYELIQRKELIPRYVTPRAPRIRKSDLDKFVGERPEEKPRKTPKRKG